MASMQTVTDTYPSIEDEETAARDAGREARRDGVQIGDNPHMKGSLQWESWRAGWKREDWASTRDAALV